MQRRAAAIYATFFILIAAGSYAMIGVAQEPTISLENPDHSLSVNDTVTVNGRTYTVSSFDDGSAELVWTNRSARYTESWDAGSTVTLSGTEFSVLVDANATPADVDLIEVRTVPENVSTVEQNGTTYVIQEEDGRKVLVPRDEYLVQEYGIPVTRRFTVGDRFSYDNNTVTVRSITQSQVTIAWTAPRNNTVTASEGANVTLNGRQFVAHLPDARTLELESDYRAYAEDVRVVETYQERINGLWAGTILSGLTAVVLLGLAYMPSRY